MASIPYANIIADNPFQYIVQLNTVDHIGLIADSYFNQMCYSCGFKAPIVGIILRKIGFRLITRLASSIWVIIDSGSGLSPVQLQAITRTNNDLSFIASSGNTFHRSFIWISIIFFHENAFEKPSGS